MNQGCWVLDGVKLSEPTCHGCYVTRSEESIIAGKRISGLDFYGMVFNKVKSTNSGMFHDIHRQCLTYPKDAELLEKGSKTGCSGLPDGETGEQCWSVCFENECNSATITSLSFTMILTYLFLVWFEINQVIIKRICFKHGLNMAFVINGRMWRHLRSSLWVIQDFELKFQVWAYI